MFRSVDIDKDLKWSIHVSELTKSFTQKLNLFKSFYFLPVNARLDFNYKVILPPITYGLIVWVSCNKTLFDKLERLHMRAARIIFGLDWCMPTEVVVLNTVKWRPLRHIYFQRLLVLVYKCYYELMPGLLKDLLKDLKT